MNLPARVAFDYQARASAFTVGARVYPLWGSPSVAGTVVAVWPAIGMVDVQYPHGVHRHPVEDLVVDDANPLADTMGPGEGKVPGGVPVAVAGGPPQSVPSAQRVARAHLRTASLSKTGIWWAARDRKFRATRAELEAGQYCCPRCEESYLRKAVFRHKNGQSERLWACGKCLFLVCAEDLLLGGG